MGVVSTYFVFVEEGLVFCIGWFGLVWFESHSVAWPGLAFCVKSA